MDRNIEAFLAVAAQGSATAAAIDLNIAQSAVTKRIANLEKSLGTALFVRDRRGMSLTEAGQLYLARASRIEWEYRFGREEISAIAAAGMTQLKVGAGPVFHLKWASGLFVALLERFPNLQLDLQTQGHEDQAEVLMSGNIDVYLGIIDQKDLDDTIVTRHVTTVEHGIVIRASDPHSQGDSIDPLDLSAYKWVSFTLDPLTERTIERYTLPRDTNRSLIDIRTTSFATGVQLVKSGQFVMSAPLQLADSVVQEGLVIKPVKNGMPRRSAGIYVRRSSLGYGAIQAVFEFFERLDCL